MNVHNFTLTLRNAAVFLRNVLRTRVRIFNPSGIRYTTSSYDQRLKSETRNLECKRNLQLRRGQLGGCCGAHILFPSFPHLPSHDGPVRPIVSRWRGLCHKCRVAYPGSRRQIGATVFTTNSILVHTFGGSRPV